MMASLRVILVLLVSVAVASPPPLKFGLTVHEMVATVAQGLLSSKCMDKARDILDGDDLTAVAGDPDSWAHQSATEWSKPFHYVNTPDVCNYDYDRDCWAEEGGKKWDGFCTTGALSNYTSRLVKSRLSNTTPDPAGDRWALTMVVHLLGDVHCPLHVGFEGDAGGQYDIEWYGKSMTLHKIWDSYIFYKFEDDEFGYGNVSGVVDWINSQLNDEWKDLADEWRACGGKYQEAVCPDQWASETIVTTCDYAYKGADPGAKLGDSYYNRALEPLQKQWAKAAVRLASVLNQVLDC
jgi:hypothetical protein